MLIDCALYRDGARHEVPAGASSADARLSGTDFYWFGFLTPTDLEIRGVAQRFEMDPLTVEDALSNRQRPKLDRYPQSTVLLLKTITYNEHTNVIRAGDVALVVGEHFIITVRHGDAPSMTSLRRDLEAHPAKMAAGPTAVMHEIIDRIVDNYQVAADALEEDIAEAEDVVFGDRAADAGRLYVLKREVLAFRRAVHPLIDPIHLLAETDVAFVDDRMRPQFKDVRDHVMRVADSIDAMNELLDAALQANLSQVQVRQNHDMRRITAWVAMAAAPTMVAGIYGMNFEYMPELEWRYGYPLVMAGLAAVTAVLFRMFRRRGWL